METTLEKKFEQAPLVPEFLDQLKKHLGAGHVLTDPADCLVYGYDNSRRQALPQGVVFPTSHTQIQQVVQLCNTYQVPLTARGRGTGTTGATVPIAGGLVLSTEKMNHILRIETGDRYLVTEPGVTNQAVQDYAGEQGFFWPPDPTSAAYCTIGGNLAYNSAGPRAVKYGTPRENVYGLRAVTGQGEEIRTGVYTSKGVVGYDLTRLIIGSEGTLAIITEATLKLTPLAEDKRTLQAVYRDIESAAEAIVNIMSQPEIPYVLEFIDGKAVDIVRNYMTTNLPKDAGAMLMIEVDGHKDYLDHAVNAINTAAQNKGLINIRTASDKKEVDDLWAARKALSPAMRKIAPKKINEDIVVPVTNIPTLVHGLEKLAQEFNITIVNFGHAGNGNIHVNLLFDADDPLQKDNASICLDRMFDLVLELNGTLSGEHGVGMEKQNFIGREIDPVTLALMQRIKQQFDPKGILNPGKMFPLDLSR